MIKLSKPSLAVYDLTKKNFMPRSVEMGKECKLEVFLIVIRDHFMLS